MNLFRRNKQKPNMQLFAVFQKVLYNRLGVQVVKYEPFYTMAWIIVFIVAGAISIRMNKSNLVSSIGLHTLLLAVVFGLVWILKYIGFIAREEHPVKSSLEIYDPELVNMLSREDIDPEKRKKIEEYAKEVLTDRWE